MASMAGFNLERDWTWRTADMQAIDRQRVYEAAIQQLREEQGALNQALIDGGVRSLIRMAREAAAGRPQDAPELTETAEPTANWLCTDDAPQRR